MVPSEHWKFTSARAVTPPYRLVTPSSLKKGFRICSDVKGVAWSARIGLSEKHTGRGFFHRICGRCASGPTQRYREPAYKSKRWSDCFLLLTRFSCIHQLRGV